MDIDYSADNGDIWLPVVSVTENDHSYTWTVPETVSDLCLVRISDSDGDDASFDTSDGVFSIVTDEPPACGEYWLGTDYTGSATVNAVVYAGGKFVAVGNNGMIMTSLNGINWTIRVSNTTVDMHGVTYGSNVFAAVGVLKGTGSYLPLALG